MNSLLRYKWLNSEQFDSDLIGIPLDFDIVFGECFHEVFAGPLVVSQYGNNREPTEKQNTITDKL